MTGEQLRPLEGRPYLKIWQERMADQNTSKMVKPKPHKGKRKKGKVAK